MEKNEVLLNKLLDISKRRKSDYAQQSLSPNMHKFKNPARKRYFVSKIDKKDTLLKAIKN